MCGVVGVFSKREPVFAAEIERAVMKLKHRGPDAESVWVSDDKRIGLGHARLSIIDLTTGDQPMASEDGRVRMVVNGEFYGYEEIRRELEKRGHKFKTQSDSEIALHLYEEQGTQFVHSLRGEFAVILWDETRRQVIAARDRFGIKPLFYAVWRDKLYLASEVSALFAAGVPARWDQQSLYQLLTTEGAHQGRTLYDGILQVPPGHLLLAAEKQTQVIPYWDFNYPKAESAAPYASDADCIAAFRTELDEAVRLRLRADVPVGVYLSGGLDSSAVLGIAARHHSGSLRAFTLSFDHDAYDETAIAEEMAKKAGAEFCPIPISPGDIADHFEDAVENSAMRFLNGHTIAKYLLSKAVRKAGYKVVLTGEGSDEVLGGYAHFRQDMLLHNSGKQNAVEVQQWMEHLAERNMASRGLLMAEEESQALGAVHRLLGFVPSWMQTFSSRAAKMKPLWDTAIVEKYGRLDGVYTIFDEMDIRGQLAGREPLHQSLYIWSKMTMANYVLTALGDRSEMAHSVEGRVPFLDHRVVEKLVSMPANIKVRGAKEKYILREAVKDVITDTVYQREKHPFLSPPATLQQDGKLWNLLQDILRSEMLKAVPMFNQKNVIALLDRVPSMDINSQVAADPLFMSIASICVLHRRFGMSAG